MAPAFVTMGDVSLVALWVPAKEDYSAVAIHFISVNRGVGRGSLKGSDKLSFQSMI